MSNIYPVFGFMPLSGVGVFLFIYFFFCEHPVLVRCNSVTVSGFDVGEIINCLLVLVLMSFGEIQQIGFI